MTLYLHDFSDWVCLYWASITTIHLIGQDNPELPPAKTNIIFGDKPQSSTSRTHTHWALEHFTAPHAHPHTTPTHALQNGPKFTSIGTLRITYPRAQGTRTRSEPRGSTESISREVVVPCFVRSFRDLSFVAVF